MQEQTKPLLKHVSKPDFHGICGVFYTYLLCARIPPKQQKRQNLAPVQVKHAFCTNLTPSNSAQKAFFTVIYSVFCTSSTPFWSPKICKSAPPPPTPPPYHLSGNFQAFQTLSVIIFWNMFNIFTRTEPKNLRCGRPPTRSGVNILFYLYAWYTMHNDVVGMFIVFFFCIKNINNLGGIPNAGSTTISAYK